MRSTTFEITPTTAPSADPDPGPGGPRDCQHPRQWLRAGAPRSVARACATGEPAGSSAVGGGGGGRLPAGRGAGTGRCTAQSAKREPKRRGRSGVTGSQSGQRNVMGDSEPVSDFVISSPTRTSHHLPRTPLDVPVRHIPCGRRPQRIEGIARGRCHHQPRFTEQPEQHARRGDRWRPCGKQRASGRRPPWPARTAREDCQG